MDARLIRKAQTGDKEALEELWRQTRAFAFTVARRYSITAYADTDDLRQCAYLGFHTAVMSHTGRYRFLSLVQWCTQRECQRLLDLYGSRRQVRTSSLDIDMPDGESTLEDLIADESLPEVAATLEESGLVRDVRAAVSELPERERRIIECRWFDGQTLSDIGKQEGISLERTRQLHERAIARLRADPVLQSYALNPVSVSRYYMGNATSFRRFGSNTERIALGRIKRSSSRLDGLLALLDAVPLKASASI